MAKLVDVSQNPDKRSKLATRTTALGIIAVLFPFIYSLVAAGLGFGGIQLFQRADIRTSVAETGESRCYVASQEAVNKNIFGMRSLHLEQRLHWCALGEEIHSVRVQNLTQASMGKWDVATPEVTELERLEGQAKVEVHQRVALDSPISVNTSGVTTYTLYADGRIEEGL